MSDPSRPDQRAEPRRPTHPQPAPDRLATFARAWAATIGRHDYLPIPRAELVTMLHRLTGQLADSLRQEPVDEATARQTGAELVTVGVRSPDSIGQTVRLAHDQLLTELGLPDPALRPRLGRLLGAVTAGWAGAVQDWVLDQQDEISRAALHARDQAERALRESERRYRYQATHDSLTDLPNRAMFTEQLTALLSPTDVELAPPQRFAVCFLDLDGFKVINDTLGYQIGDLLLAAVADRLRRRLPDRLVARLGGDEFVILIGDCESTGEAVEATEAALAAVAEPVLVDGHELTVTASAGIVERDRHTSDPTEMMRAADITLRWAKATGRGRWALFDPERHEQQLTRYAMSAAMPQALEREEFFLEYQPIVSLWDNTVLGAEALVRWRHPEWGVLPPDRFIGLADETGLITRLGDWVLGQACREARDWPAPDRTGSPPFVSVNLAVRQVRDPGLPDAVTRWLAETGLPPDRLQLEITEGAVVSTDDETMTTLRRLAERGIRIAVDDFGTGYSNLTYLRHLPLREIKLASSFAAGMSGPVTPDSPDSQATNGRIMATLVLLAHSLGLTVTAEGVETEPQAEWLRVIGCDAAQGWRFGRPGAPHRLRQLLRPPARIG